MKKVLAMILIMTMIMSLFTGCVINLPATNTIDPDLNNNADINADEIEAEENDIDINNETKKPVKNNVSRKGFTSSEDFLERIENYIDMPLYKVDRYYTDGQEYSTTINLSLKYEHKKPFNFDYKIKIDNETIRLPISFADMKMTSFSTNIEDDYQISNKMIYDLKYTTSEGRTFTVSTSNFDAYFEDDEVFCDIIDCSFNEFEVYPYDLKDTDPLYYERDESIADFEIQGITADSTVEDVLTAIKNPTGISYNEADDLIMINYLDPNVGNSGTSADYSSFYIYFSVKYNCIKTIRYNF